jgi:hypothetical protein
MIKNHRKLIAAFAACAFIFLLHASSMPLRSEQAPSQSGTTMESTEQAPHFIEEEGGYRSQPKKKSIMPIILGVVVVGAVAAVLFLVVLKNKYDITGTWTLNFIWKGSTASDATLVFFGNTKSGSFKSENSVGTYTVDGKNVVWVYPIGTKYTGTFSDKQNMSGTMLGFNGSTGIWTAKKNATAAAIHASMAASEGKSVNSDGEKLQ